MTIVMIDMDDIMGGEIHNNGNKYVIHGGYISNGHQTIYYRDMKEASFQIDEGESLNKLLGRSKGILSIVYGCTPSNDEP